MKKIKQILTVLALCLSCAVAYAVDNADLYYINNGVGLYYRVLSEARGTVAVACGDVSSIEPYPEMIMEHEYMWWKGNVYKGDVVIPAKITSLAGRTESREYSVTQIGTGAFSRCEDLLSVSIPESVTEIDTGAFNWCQNLSSITIPDGVTLIGERAFYGCKKLHTVILPDIQQPDLDKSFTYCPAISLIRIAATLPPALSGDWASEVAPGCVLEVPEEAVEAYRNAPYWKEFTTIRAIQASVEAPAAEAFSAIGMQGAIKVEGTAHVSVHDAEGLCVYTGGAAEVSLAPGLYIVSAPGAESVKVLVK